MRAASSRKPPWSLGEGAGVPPRLAAWKSSSTASGYAKFAAETGLPTSRAGQTRRTTESGEGHDECVARPISLRSASRDLRLLAGHPTGWFWNWSVGSRANPRALSKPDRRLGAGDRGPVRRSATPPSRCANRDGERFYSSRRMIADRRLNLQCDADGAGVSARP